MLLRNPHSHIILAVIITYLLFVSESDSRTGNSLARRKRYVVFPEGSSFSVALCMTVHTLTPDNIFTEGLNWGISYDLPNESKSAIDPFLKQKKNKMKIQKEKMQPQPKPQAQPEASEYYYDHSYSHTPISMYDDYNNHNNIGWENEDNIGWDNEDNVGWDNHDNDGWNSHDNVGWNNDGKYYIMPGGKKYYKANYHYLQRRYRRDLYNKIEVIINAMGFDGRTCILRALCEASRRLMPKGNSLVEEMMRIIFTLPLKRVFSFEPEEHRTYTDAHKAGHEGGNCAAMFSGCSFSLIDMALGKYNAPDGSSYASSSYGGNPDVSERVTGTLATRRRADILAPDLRYTMK